jgi:serine protease
MDAWAAHHRAAKASHLVSYGGGVKGIGVTTGPEKVYLVVYGSQWGTGAGAPSNDPSGEVPYLEKFFKGLGTDGEKWSGVMTQYCQGVPKKSTSCPAANTQHVAYPSSGGALAGVWLDTASPSPKKATGHQLGEVAVAAAKHFGNTTATANRDAQYFIMSPTGTRPSGFGGGVCAWHDYTGDKALDGGGAVTSPYGPLAFTNMPYVTDQGKNCAEDAVNPHGTDDGVSMVAGHEYAETITDQDPPGGWLGHGSEVGDLCVVLQRGLPSSPFDLKLATGTFAVQTIWGNDGNGGKGACEASHPVVTNP